MKTLRTLFKQDKEKFVVPKSVQTVIPIKTIWEDGIFLVGKNKYAKTFKFEDINYAAIEASADLAKEKGSYLYFEGSDWQTGEYFVKRGYTSARWNKLRAEVAGGMRNAYLMAVAPTSSTSIIAGTTAGLDPVMKKFFFEEKKGAMIPRVAPELGPATYWLYKNAHLIDQTWTVKAAGIRQRHIDQAQSLNLYITNEYTMRQVMNLYILAWEEGVKTIYYIRSKSLEVEECESCSA